MRTRTHVTAIRLPRLALALSAIWPGLGQWYLAEGRLAALLALPPLLVLLPLIASAARGPVGLLAYLVVPQNAVLLAAAIITSLVFHLASIGHVLARLGPVVRRSHRTFTVLAVGAVLVVHVLPLYGTIGLFGVTSRVFSVNAPPRPEASGPVPSSDRVVGTLPSAGAVMGDERLTILLVGSDFGTGYQHSLTDTMMVVSVDVSNKAVVMASLPRDTARFPMFDGSTYNGKLNSLMTFAASRPARYPEGGIATLAHEVSYLVGIPIQYIAYVNLSGFATLIDSVGGVDVVVAQPIDDPVYQFEDGARGFQLSAGPHHLNGRTAMAYVRSRYGAGDNDFTRARRQQELLIALKNKLLSPSILPQLPSTLDAISRLITTNYPPEGLGRLVDLSQQIPPEAVRRFVLGPPYAVKPAGGGEYVLVPDMNRYAKWSISVFGKASRYVSG